VPEKKSVGTVEGAGGLSCIHSSHSEPFIASSIEELEEHHKDGNHTTSGAAPCAVCSNEVTFDSLPYGKKPLCDNCKAELLSQ